MLIRALITDIFSSAASQVALSVSICLTTQVTISYTQLSFLNEELLPVAKEVLVTKELDSADVFDRSFKVNKLGDLLLDGEVLDPEVLEDEFLDSAKLIEEKFERLNLSNVTNLKKKIKNTSNVYVRSIGDTSVQSKGKKLSLNFKKKSSLRKIASIKSKVDKELGSDSQDQPDVLESISDQGIVSGVGGSSNNEDLSLDKDTEENSPITNIPSEEEEVSSFDAPPVTSSFVASDIYQNSSRFMNLIYSDPEGDLASSCSVFNLVELTVMSSCSCDSNGVCSVEVQGTMNDGPVSFDYTVTSLGKVSNTSSVTFNTLGESFISTWRTTAPNESITLPLKSSYNYNFTVDWGDGSPIKNIVSWNDIEATHTYAVAGDYTITLTGIAEAWYFNNSGDKDKILEVHNFGSMGWINLDHAFHGCNNLTTFLGGNMESVTNMNSMFFYAPNVTPDTSGWDTSNVIDMTNLFFTASNAAPDTSNWNTSNVTSFAHMFRGIVGNPDVSNWDTSNVENMSHMFFQAVNANPDTSGWNTSNVTKMESMFYGATLADPDTSGWDTSNVTNFSFMFYAAASARPDTSNWNTSNVTDMRSMFHSASSANPDTSTWNTSNVTSMNSMFNAASIADPNTSSWDTSNVTNMGSMFYNASLANPDTSGWDTSKVVDMQSMFYNASLANPDTSGWDTTLVTNFHFMFRNASAANPNTSGWNTSNVTSMNSMFYNAVNANPDTSGWNTVSVVDMENMFNGAVAANPDTSSWNTSNVTSFTQMFYLNTLANPDVSGWDTSNVLEMQSMFYGASSANPDVSNWNFANVANFTFIFNGSMISDANYSQALIRIDQTNTLNNLILDASHANYNVGAAAARSNLIANGWVINDAGAQ